MAERLGNRASNLSNLQCFMIYIYICVSVQQRLPVSLGSEDEVVGVVPVGQEVSGLLIVYTDVVVGKRPWEKVIDLPGHVQDITNPVSNTKHCDESLVQ